MAVLKTGASVNAPGKPEPFKLPADQVLAALSKSVRNNALGEDVPVGISVQLNYLSVDGQYWAWTSGARDAHAYAPTLELAIVALGYLGDGENITVDAYGQLVCGECRGDGKVTGCDECGNTGHADETPDGWPTNGILADRPNFAELGWSSLENLAHFTADAFTYAEDHNDRLKIINNYGAHVAEIIRALHSPKDGAA